MGGAGNIPVIAPLVEEISLAHGGPPAPWSFPDAGRYLELLEAAGFTVGPDPGSGDGTYVRTVAQRRAFDRDSLLGWLRSQCYQGFEIAMPPANHAALPRRGRGPPRRAAPPRRQLRPDLRPPRRPRPPPRLTVRRQGDQPTKRPTLNRPTMA